MEASDLAIASNGLEYLPAFLTSLSIGLFVGLKRERSPAAKAGLRTFALTSLLGTLLALLSEHMDSPWLLAAGLLAVAGLIVSAYLDGSRTDDPERPHKPRCCCASASVRWSGSASARWRCCWPWP